MFSTVWCISLIDIYTYCTFRTTCIVWCKHISLVWTNVTYSLYSVVCQSIPCMFSIKDHCCLISMQYWLIVISYNVICCVDVVLFVNRCCLLFCCVFGKFCLFYCWVFCILYCTSNIVSNGMILYYTIQLYLVE